jgi:DnaJ-domain-containing protein 1
MAFVHLWNQQESNMGDAKDHLRNFSELSQRIVALGKSIKRAEKDLKFQWVDEIEQRDLQDIKEHMKSLEDALRMSQAEMGHIEAEHLKR